jgi:uncharacterized BrkB/YihY/UPF0761 family membrane protein
MKMNTLIGIISYGDRIHGVVVIIAGILLFAFRSGFIRQTKAFNRLFSKDDKYEGTFVDVFPVFFSIILVIFGVLLVTERIHLHH